MGKLLITPTQFFDYTIPQFFAAWHGYFDQQHIERLRAFYAVNAFAKVFNEPKDLYWLPGDPLPPKPKTKEEREAFMELAKTKWTAQV